MLARRKWQRVSFVAAGPGPAVAAAAAAEDDGAVPDLIPQPCFSHAFVAEHEFDFDWTLWRKGPFEFGLVGW